MEIILMMLAIALVGCVIWLFYGDDIEFRFECGGYNPICKTIQKAKEEGDFFRQINFFKKLLQKEARLEYLVKNILDYYKRSSCRMYLYPCEETAVEIWHLSEHRHLFSPEELSVIDEANKKIEPARLAYETICKAQENQRQGVNKEEIAQQPVETESTEPIVK